MDPIKETYSLQDLDYDKDFVPNLVKDGNQIVSELTGFDADALHMAVGIAGEAGELLDAIKRGAIYRKPYDKVNITEELGDLEFFMSHIRSLFGLTREEVILANKLKLSARYKSLNYSNNAAQAREDKQPNP